MDDDKERTTDDPVEKADDEDDAGASSALNIRTRVAAILVEIDANDLNNVLACRHYIIFKIGDFLSCSEHAFSLLGQPN